MDFKSKHINLKTILGIIISIPILIIIIIVLCRNLITPSNQEIIDKLHNTENYSSKVDYTFINSKGEYKESTMQYYSADKGMRIEFQDEDGRVKVYKGSEIKVQDDNGKEYMVDKNLDDIYPLSFMENILSNSIVGNIEAVESEWSDTQYLKVSIDYPSKNKHLDKAEFYIDKKTRVPVLLKILDDDGKERILISYKEFKVSKELDENLF